MSESPTSSTIIKRNAELDDSQDSDEDINSRHTVNISTSSTNKAFYMSKRRIYTTIFGLFTIICMILSIRIYYSGVDSYGEREALESKERIDKIRNSTLQAAKTSNFSLISQSDRPLVLYHHHETPYARRNVLFFIEHGLHSRADFIFVVNGESDIGSLIPKEATNVRIIKRNNTCFDLGAIGEVLRSNNQELVKKYKKFILMNSSKRTILTYMDKRLLE
jgi:hypothetical protein